MDPVYASVTSAEVGGADAAVRALQSASSQGEAVGLPDRSLRWMGRRLSKRSAEDRAMGFVPASLNRFLKPFQRVGVTWLWQTAYACPERGGVAVLADDMGLGKTVQLLAFLAAVYCKAGAASDRDRFAEQRARREQLLQQWLATDDPAGDCGAGICGDASEATPFVAPGRFGTTPTTSLIFVPANLLLQWKGEIDRWGYFDYVCITAEDTAEVRSSKLDRVRRRQVEVALVSRSFLSRDAAESPMREFLDPDQPPWECVVVDEVHEGCRNEGTRMAQNLRRLRCVACVGLSGTPMQNQHSDLLHLLTTTMGPDRRLPPPFDSPERFRRDCSLVAKRGRVSAATPAERRAGVEAERCIREGLLRPYMLQRSKVEVAGEHLPEKKEVVVFCRLGEEQERVYRHIVEGSASARLVVNGEDAHLSSLWRRQHSMKCPGIGLGSSSGASVYDTRDPLGDGLGPRFRPCGMCPAHSCCTLPLLQVLHQVCQHTDLLCFDSPGAAAVSRASAAFRQRRIKAVVQEFLAPVRCDKPLRPRSSFQSHAKRSGKLAVLGQLLDRVLPAARPGLPSPLRGGSAAARGSTAAQRPNKVLVFFSSVKMLTVVRELLAKDPVWRRSHAVFTGAASRRERTAALLEFETSTHTNILLLSVQAGSVGLNLVAANHVVLFDPSWNPATDAQAQDRAFRLGQTRDVTVYRLATSGTVEEVVFLRQAYKLTQTAAVRQTLEGGGRFQGIQPPSGWPPRFKPTSQGVLWGRGNLLQYRPGGGFRRQLLEPTRAAAAASGSAGSGPLDLDAIEDGEEDEPQTQETTGMAAIDGPLGEGEFVDGSGLCIAQLRLAAGAAVADEESGEQRERLLLDVQRGAAIDDILRQASSTEAFLAALGPRPLDAIPQPAVAAAAASSPARTGGTVARGSLVGTVARDRPVAASVVPGLGQVPQRRRRRLRLRGAVLAATADSSEDEEEREDPVDELKAAAADFWS